MGCVKSILLIFRYYEQGTGFLTKVQDLSGTKWLG